MSTGIAEVVQPARLLDDGVVLLAARLVDEIVPVLADHRPVRRNDRDLEFIDLEKLALFRLRRAGHAGQLVVHAEVVLNRDRRHRLRLALDADAFLGFDRLVQTLRPTTARHRAAGELVDDQHFAFLHDVVHVALVQRVRAQQLVDDVQPLRLRRVLDLDLAPRLDLLLGRHVVVVIDAMHLLRQIRQDERVVLVRRHEVDALVGEVDRVALLIEHEEQVFLDVAIRLLGRRQPTIGDVVELHLLHELLGARLLQHLHQARDSSGCRAAPCTAGARPPPCRSFSRSRSASPTSVFTSSVWRRTRRPTAALCSKYIPSFSLPTGPEMMSGVRASSMSTESTSSTIAYVCGRCTRWSSDDHHVVAQVVEAELVVRAVRDVREVRGAALGRSRLRVVEARDREAEIVVEVPHPLRVAAGEVRVHRDEMRALAGQRVQIERQRRDERLAFARRHLGDLAEVQLDAAHELHVVVHHVPRQLAARDHHRRADEPARALAHRGERLGQNLVEHVGDLLAQLAFGAAAAVARRSTRRRCARARPGSLAVRFCSLSVGDARLELARALPNDLAELRGLRAQLLLRDMSAAARSAR